MKLEIIKEKQVFVGVGIVLIVAFGWAFSSGKTESKEITGSKSSELRIADITSSEKTDVQHSSSEDRIDSHVAQKASCVHHEVSGAVLTPGVYCLPPESLLVDLVERAGGFDLSKYASRYITQKLNLAEVIVPNKKYYIPYEWDMPSSVNYIASPQTANKQEEAKQELTEQPSPSNPGGSCININSASVDELDSLDGIGPATAEKVISARPFSKIEDLLNVSGIGEATFNKFKDKICV